MRGAGLEPGAAHHAHALHSPYWWLKCAVGPTNDDHPLVKAYHRLLVWDIARRSPAPSPGSTERLLNPVLGKSLVVYAAQARPSERRRSSMPIDVPGRRWHPDHRPVARDRRRHRRVAAADRA